MPSAEYIVSNFYEERKTEESEELGVQNHLIEVVLHEITHGLLSDVMENGNISISF